MRVHVTKAGSGPVIVATAGIGKTGRSWDALTEHLADRFTVVAWDLLGHGQSPTPDDPAEYSRDRALEDLDDVVTYASEISGSRPVMLGHSLGGYLTLAWAATRAVPPPAMILLATGPGFRDEAKREAWNARSRRNAHRFGVPTQAAELNLQADGVVIEKVPAMTSPTLLLVGSEDRADLQGGSSYLAAKMPNAELVAIEGGDHLMHEGAQAATIAKAISAFLSDIVL